MILSSFSNLICNWSSYNPNTKPLPNWSWETLSPISNFVLTKLESFSVKNTFDQANFYLDLEGHLEQPGVKKALVELGFHTETLDILGVYEASPFRQK